MSSEITPIFSMLATCDFRITQSCYDKKLMQIKIKHRNKKENKSFYSNISKLVVVFTPAISRIL